MPPEELVASSSQRNVFFGEDFTLWHMIEFSVNITCDNVNMWNEQYEMNNVKSV